MRPTVRALLLAAILTCQAFAALVTISDTIYNADGTKATGTLTLTWKSFDSLTGVTIVGNQLRRPFVTGAISLAMEPNPAGTFYAVQYDIVTRTTPARTTSYAETWIVPTGGPYKIQDVRTSVLPTTQTTLLLDQLSTAGAGKGDLIAFSTKWQRFPKCAGGQIALWDASQATGMKCGSVGGDLVGDYQSLSLVQYGSQNYLLRSQEFDNAAWACVPSPTGTCTVDANTIAAPDGSSTADRVTTTIDGVLLQSVTGTDLPRTCYTGSVWVRADGVVNNYYMALLMSKSGAGSWSLQESFAGRIDAAWQRVAVTACPRSNTAVAPDTLRLTAQAATNSQTVATYLWGAQINRGTVAADYIATAATAKTDTGVDAVPEKRSSRFVSAPPQADGIDVIGIYPDALKVRSMSAGSYLAVPTFNDGILHTTLTTRTYEIGFTTTINTIDPCAAGNSGQEIVVANVGGVVTLTFEDNIALYAPRLVLATNGEAILLRCSLTQGGWMVVNANSFAGERTVGFVPVPAIGDAALNKFLKADGVWTNPTAGGSAGQAVCWKTATTLGFCSTIVGADGSCTCN